MSNITRIEKPKPKELKYQSKFPYLKVAIIGAILSFIISIEAPFNIREAIREEIRSITK